MTTQHDDDKQPTFYRMDGGYYHADCLSDTARENLATVAVASDFDDDEDCAECGSPLVTSNDNDDNDN